MRQLFFLCGNKGAVFKITMSFGFGLGDFVAVYQLADKIRKEFANAPNQFKDISDEWVIQTDNQPILTV